VRQLSLWGTVLIQGSACYNVPAVSAPQGSCIRLVAVLIASPFAWLQGKGPPASVALLVVFLSLVFRGWALGQVGMLLSVPLIIAARIALDSHAGTHWLAIMPGPKVEPPVLPDCVG
jgi:hypothetical protein